MSDANEEIAANIKANRSYIKKARKALIEARNTIRKNGRGRYHRPIENSYPIENLQADSMQKPDSENLGRFISSRNKKGWLKRII